MGEDSIRHFTEEEIPTDNKIEKQYSRSLWPGKCTLKPQCDTPAHTLEWFKKNTRLCYTPAKIWNSQKAHTFPGECKMVPPLCRFLITVNSHLIVQSLQLTKINFLNYFHTDFIHNIKYVNNSKVHQQVKGQTKSSQCAQRSITQQ